MGRLFQLPSRHLSETSEKGWTTRITKESPEGDLFGELVGPAPYDVYRWTYHHEVSGVRVRYASHAGELAEKAGVSLPMLGKGGLPPGLDLAVLWGPIKERTTGS